MASRAPPPDTAERRLHELIVDSMQEAVVTVGLDHRVLSWSKGAERLYGWTSAEAVGEPIYALMGKELRPEAFGAVLQRLQAEGRGSETGERRRKDGSRLLAETNYVLVRNDAGAPSCVLGVSRDVTDAAGARTRALDQARLRGLDERINEVEFVVRLDGSLVHANDRAVETYGFTRDELLALNVRDLRAEWTRTEVATQMARATEAGIRFATEHLRKDGTTFPVEVSSRAFRVGGEIFLHSLVRDLTEPRCADRQRLLLAGLVESMAEGAVVSDVDLRVTGLAGRAEQVYGWPREEALGKRLTSDFTYEFPDGDRDAIRARLEAGLEARCHLRLLRRDGGWAELDVSTTPLRDEAGRLAGWLSVARDVGDALAARRALLESERRLALVLEGSRDGFWDWDVQSGQVQYSERWATMLGYRRDELEPHVRAWERLVHPEDLERVQRAVQALLDGQVEHYECEHRVRRKDGTWGWILDRGKVVERSAEGRPVRAAGTHTDITARKEAQARLAASEERLARVLEGSEEGYFELLPATRAAMFSASMLRIIGEGAGDLPQTMDAWDARVHPDDRPKLDATAAALLGGSRDRFDLEYRVRARDGAWRWVSVRARTMPRTADAEPLRVAGTVRDITEVRTLSGLLPICMYCKKIRDDQGYWERIEKYIVEHSQAEFTHGLCPECDARLRQEES